MTLISPPASTEAQYLRLCRARDYFALPPRSPRCQLVNGILHMAPSPSFSHQNSSGRLFFLLYQHVSTHNLGVVLAAPLDVHLDSTNVYQPDLLFISEARKSIIRDSKIKGAPDIVVEILSKSTRKLDEVEKFQKYHQHGVGEVWFVDTQHQTITVHDFTKKKAPVVRKHTAADILTTPRLPGLELAVGSVMG